MPQSLRWLLGVIVLSGSFLCVAAEPVPENGESPEKELRIASIDLQTLFANYHQTHLAEAAINNERARIAKASQRAGEEVRQRRQALQEREQRVKGNAVPAEEKAQFAREKPILEREIALLRRKQEKDRNKATARLNGKMEARMDEILRELTRRASRYAEEEGYHVLYDSSGTNSEQVPPILASSQAVDITSELAAIFAREQEAGN